MFSNDRPTQKLLLHARNKIRLANTRGILNDFSRYVRSGKAQGWSLEDIHDFVDLHMKIGAISEFDFQLVSPAGKDWKIHNFSISKDSLSFEEMPDSAFATPARYVQEIFYRLCLLEQQDLAQTKFIFNPIFETNRQSIYIVLNELSNTLPIDGLAVFEDVNGLPVGYLFPAWLQKDECQFLTLLSTVDGSVDAALLRLLFPTETRRVRIGSLRVDRFDSCGFSYRNFRDIYLWGAEKAVRVLGACSSAGDSQVLATHGHMYRGAIPFTAIMPCHAGDVLFFALAFNKTRTHMSRIAVHRAYADIVSDNAPRLSTVVIESPPPNRNNGFQEGHTTTEYGYFHQIKNFLPDDSFYYFCRQSRNYNLTEFHLIDHFAFALGRHCCSNERLLINSTIPPPRYRPRPEMEQTRILLHFDGGWLLKVYPEELQTKLVELLHAKGYDITILAGSGYKNNKCRVATFSNYRGLTELIRSHHLLVGMDSFPCHYGAHILGVPTICLFSSTRPANSNASRSSYYSSLELGLKCRPCYAAKECPLYGGSNCRNFVSPEVVANEVDKMLRSACLEKTDVLACGSTPEDDCYLTVPGTSLKKKAKRINGSHLGAKAMFAGLLIPVSCYSSTLQREFVASVEREGVVGALRRTGRYIRRLLRSVSA